MIRYVILDGDYPRQVGQSPRLPDGAIEVDFDPVDLLDCMLVDGLWEQRPAIAAPVITGGHVVFSGLPAGTEVTVRDVEAGFDLAVIAATAGVIDFELTDAATYQLTAIPPLPWMRWEGQLTC